jgi:hypothetical protein
MEVAEKGAKNMVNEYSHLGLISASTTPSGIKIHPIGVISIVLFTIMESFR